jgi:hypothetical protein
MATPYSGQQRIVYTIASLGMPFYPTDIRLQRDAFGGRQIYFVTICCEKRKAVFQDMIAARKVLEGLTGCAKAKFFLLHAFCFMPDHLHLLVEGTKDTGDRVKLWMRLSRARDFATNVLPASNCGKRDFMTTS